jgi:hypothetical protein
MQLSHCSSLPVLRSVCVLVLELAGQFKRLVIAESRSVAGYRFDRPKEGVYSDSEEGWPSPVLVVLPPEPARVAWIARKS